MRIRSLPANADERATVRGLSGRPEVEFAELDEMHLADGTPNDPRFVNQWHLSKIACPSAWNNSVGDSAVVIAILDTGVDSAHPDLAQKLVSGWNFWGNNNTADVYGHGAQVAGTAAAATNNSNCVAGVGWDCFIMPIRISDVNGSGSSSAIAIGLVFAADRLTRNANIPNVVIKSSTVRLGENQTLC